MTDHHVDSESLEFEWLESLFAELASSGRSEWAESLRRSAGSILDPETNGHFTKWNAAVDALPRLPISDLQLDQDAVGVLGDCSDDQKSQLRAELMRFHPWRKGPFQLFGVHIDSEWRSDSKWLRVQPHIDLQGKRVLDVGCGNGYYGWRMLGDGARHVIGLEPYPLYVMQYAAMQNYMSDLPNYVVPASDTVIPKDLNYFDVVFSMGVLYHSKDPFGHLEKLRHSLLSGGTVVLETLVVEGDVDTIFVPPGRYAKMRNVWLLPSPLALERILQRVGFKNVRVVDVTKTTKTEQRSTDWMTFESLSDFLAPDGSKTIEGHLPPTRAVVVAEK